jgi:DNA polymerase (family 10)
MDMSQSEMTKRVLKALAHPAVSILAHPTGRLINEREPFAIDLEQIFHAAKEYNVAVELNAQPDRLDLNDLHLFRAQEIGVQIVVNTDAHNTEQLRFIKYGIDQARRGWLKKRHVVNTLPYRQFEAWLKQRRQMRGKPSAKPIAKPPAGSSKNKSKRNDFNALIRGNGSLRTQRNN